MLPYEVYLIYWLNNNKRIFRLDYINILDNNNNNNNNNNKKKEIIINIYAIFIIKINIYKNKCLVMK